MSLKVSRKDILWNYIGNILNIGVNILILPVILRILSSKELGLWYVFSSISSLTHLLEFGFNPTIMRNITYAWSGAKSIMKEGTNNSIYDDNPNYSLLRSLTISSKRIYFIISIIAYILILTIGTVYIMSLLPNKETKYIVS